MKATTFECRQQTLLHLLLVGIAVLTYLRDPVDIVWAFVQRHSDSAALEHLVFGVGALFLVSSAALETWANARQPQIYLQHALRLARFLLVLAVGLLLPAPGTVLLLLGETALMVRLYLREQESAALPQLPIRSADSSWSLAFRAASSKWGLAASMIVFACTLQDRIAEIGAICSVVLWLALNLPARTRTQPH